MKRHIARRLHLVPLFRRKLKTLPLAIANPVWVEDADVELDYHVRRFRLPRPGTLAQLEAYAARIHSTLMDRSRPLWEAHVIDGLNTGQVGLYVRVHHAVLDGAAGMLLTGALLDPTPVPRKVPRPPRSKRADADAPGIGELARAALRHDVAQYARLLGQLPDLVGILAGTGSQRAWSRCGAGAQEPCLRAQDAAQRVDHWRAEFRGRVALVGRSQTCRACT